MYIKEVFRRLRNRLSPRQTRARAQLKADVMALNALLAPGHMRGRTASTDGELITHVHDPDANLFCLWGAITRLTIPADPEEPILEDFGEERVTPRWEHLITLVTYVVQMDRRMPLDKYSDVCGLTRANYRGLDEGRIPRFNDGAGYLQMQTLLRKVTKSVENL